MSDGLSDANHAEHVSARIESATLDLLDALRECYDQAFGLPEDAIVEMSEILAEVGVKMVLRGRR